MDCWIPDLLPSYDGSSAWTEYEERLYRLFRRDFVDSIPMFRGEPVYIRVDPRYEGREEGFWHLTCRDYQKLGDGPVSRDPELSRCERIEWPRAFIEGYLLCKACDPDDCGGILVYTEDHKSRTSKKFVRYVLLSVEERYIVVLEHRPNRGMYFLITAFYIEEEYKLKACLRQWERHKVLA